MQRPWKQVTGLAVLVLLLWKLLCFMPGRNRDIGGEEIAAVVGEDKDASLARLSNKLSPAQDTRGWLLDPLKAASRAGLSGGATECRAVHAGEIRAGGVRANHRHHYCNETFIVWNARAVYRLENAFMDSGYAQAVLEAGDVSVCTAPAGRAHALFNVDRYRTLYLVACQDASFDSKNPMTDYRAWGDLVQASQA